MPLLVDPKHVHRMVLKRLIFEAYTQVAADLKMRAVSRQDDVPIQIPSVEREHRWTQLEARLSGLTFSGEIEPSHQIQDFSNQCFDRNELPYPAWHLCNKRDQELGGVKRELAWSFDPTRNLKQSEGPAPQVADW